MFLLLTLSVLVVVASLVYVQFWTIRTIWRRNLTQYCKLAAVALVVFGSICGFVSGTVVRWQPSANVEYVGFPIPGMELLYEDGRWVDYVGPTILISPCLNALIVGTVCLLPLTVALVVRH